MLLFSRGCDFYSTSLWFFEPGGMEGETNPLTSIFGVGWTGLIFTNAILIALIIYAFYYYSFRHTPKTTATRHEKLTDYVSEIYFNAKGKFKDIFYKTPNNKKILLAHAGYVLTRVVIVASFFATIHNLCQFYEVHAYAVYREIVGRPLFVIYGLILLSILFFSYRLWKKEFMITNPERVTIK